MDSSIKDYNRQVSGQTKMAGVRDGSLKPLQYSDFDGQRMEDQPSIPVTAFELQRLHEFIGNVYVNAAQTKASLQASLNNPALGSAQKRVAKIMIQQIDKILGVIADPENAMSLRKLLDKITISG